jgi:hypothetical protein
MIQFSEQGHDDISNAWLSFLGAGVTGMDSIELLMEHAPRLVENTPNKIVEFTIFKFRNPKCKGWAAVEYLFRFYVDNNKVLGVSYFKSSQRYAGNYELTGYTSTLKSDKQFRKMVKRIEDLISQKCTSVIVEMDTNFIMDHFNNN